jgi:hypothetical protein
MIQKSLSVQFFGSLEYSWDPNKPVCNNLFDSWNVFPPNKSLKIPATRKFTYNKKIPCSHVIQAYTCNCIWNSRLDNDYLQHNIWLPQSCLSTNRVVNVWWAEWAIAQPGFGRIEVAAGQQRRAASLSNCPPSVRYLLTPLTKYILISYYSMKMSRT